MQYLLLIYENEGRFATLDEPALNAEVAEYRSLAGKHQDIIRGGHPLQPTETAITVRVREGQVLRADGPFAETKEQLGGYYLVDAPDREAALAMAEKIPAARYGCIEVRPIMCFA